MIILLIAQLSTLILQLLCFLGPKMAGTTMLNQNGFCTIPLSFYDNKV